jgi:hypothetical protein
VVDLIGSVTMYAREHVAKGTEIKTFGQAVFFTTERAKVHGHPVIPWTRVVHVSSQIVVRDQTFSDGSRRWLRLVRPCRWYTEWAAPTHGSQ